MWSMTRPVGGAFIPYLGYATIMSMIRHAQDEKFYAVFYLNDNDK
jgi:hypothetical protein